MAGRADRGIDRVAQGGVDGAAGQFLGGMLLGAVWSPCVGPTLGGAISLAAQGESLGRAGATMAAFALGVSTVILGLGYGARTALRRRQAALRALADWARPAMGVIFVGVGLMLFFQLHHVLEGWLLDILPIWLQDVSVSI